MSARKKRRPRTLIEMQTDAQNYARDAFAVTPFHLSRLSSEDFSRTAAAIMSALVQAWAAGYSARGQEASR